MLAISKLFISEQFTTLQPQPKRNKVINTHGQSALDIKANKIEVSKMNKNDI